VASEPDGKVAAGRQAAKRLGRPDTRLARSNTSHFSANSQDMRVQAVTVRFTIAVDRTCRGTLLDST
jgi:hypothetical protein